MKSRKLGIVFLLLMAFVVTTGTFAYWASSVSGPATGNTTGTITVGSGEAVTTSFSLTGSPATGGLLTPAGLANAGEGEVESVDLVFGVQWTEDVVAGANINGATGTLNVSWVVTVSNGGDVTSIVAPYVNVSNPDASTTSPYTQSITLDAAAQNLTWTITLDEPTLADYASVAGATITVTFTWTVTAISAS